MKPKPWYRFADRTDPKVADIYVMDAIAFEDFWGDGSVCTPKQFLGDLAALPADVGTIRVHINSPGGDVFAAIGIANALREQAMSKGRTVETIVDGLAASAATIVMMAGSKVTVSDNSLVMIHNPWTIALGNAADMRKQADMLDQVTETIIATYLWHVTELSADDIRALMDAETWMDAADAITYGFATDKVEGLKAAASIDPVNLAKLKVPEKFAARVAALAASTEEPAPAPAPVSAPEEPAADPAPAVEEPSPAVEPSPAAAQPSPVEAAARPEDVLAMCVTAGLEATFALQLMKDGTSPADAAQLISAEKDKRAADAQRKADITALCINFKCEDMLATVIDLPFDRAKEIVARVKSKVDVVEIQAHLQPHGGDAPQKPRVDTAAIYRARNYPAAQEPNVLSFKRSER